MQSKEEVDGGCGGEDFCDVGGGEVGDAGMDRDGGVEAGDVAAGGFGLGQGVAGVGLVEEDLALEVGGFDEVAVDEGEGADAGAGEERGGGRSGGSAADDGDVGVRARCCWPARPMPGKRNLAGVAVLIDCGWGGGRRGLDLGEGGGHGIGRAP